MMKAQLVLAVCAAILLAHNTPTHAQGIPLPDLGCINTKLILKTANCYLMGLGSLFLGGDDPVPTETPAEEPTGGSLNLNIRFTGFTGVPDEVSPIRQTPGAAHLDRLSDYLNAAKVNLDWAADSFHQGLMSEAKTQEEITKILAFEQELMKQLNQIDQQEISEFFARSVAEKVAEFQSTLNFIRSTIQKHITPEMVEAHKDDMAGIQDLEDNIPDWILEIACGIEPRLCIALDMAQHVIDCLNTYGRTDFEDGLKYLNCLINCTAINSAIPCVHEAFSECGPISWVGDLINKVLIQYLELEHCEELEMLPPDDTTLLDLINAQLPPGVEPYTHVVSEGGDAELLKIYNNMPPATYCFDFKKMLSSPAGLLLGVGRIVSSYLFSGKICNVNLELWWTNHFDALRGHNIVHDIPFTDDFVFGEPMCRNGYLLSQIKIGEHGYNVDSDNQCKLRMTNDNWSGNFTVPIRATADLKADGDRDVYLTVKLVVGSIHAKTMRAKILVQDNEAEVPGDIHSEGAHGVCRSTSDVHTTTFDGGYYNNMYHGYFHLYRNQNLPYEVQVVYQTCTTSQSHQGTCNCGVAVRIGDDVFVVDRCRREDGADQPMRAQLYLNGNLTLGTFIYSEYEGQRYHVVLPHGETVRIVKDEHPNVINVMIKPSSFDFGTNRAEGLCGQHTGSSADDYLLPDGSIYLGPGTGEGEQPSGFIEAWRVGDANLIFEGAFESQEFDTGRYCRCHFLPILGPLCRCDTNIVEMCDMVVGDDVTATFVETALPSNPAQGLDGVTLDDEFVPGDMPSWDDSGYSENDARRDCEDYSNEHPMVDEYKRRICPLIGSCKPNERVEFGCMDDVLLTQDTQWFRTSREAVKDQILDRETRPLLKTEYQTRTLSDLMCLNDCNDNGACVGGLCECNSGWSGATCDVASMADATVTSVTQLCDVSKESCRYAMIYGANFDASMKCYLRPIEATPEGPKPSRTSNKHLTVDLVYISQEQVACALPEGEETSYSVFIWRQVAHHKDMSDKHNSVANFIVYDSTTTQCDAATASCHAKTAAKPKLAKKLHKTVRSNRQ